MLAELWFVSWPLLDVAVDVTLCVLLMKALRSISVEKALTGLKGLKPVTNAVLVCLVVASCLLSPAEGSLVGGSIDSVSDRLVLTERSTHLVRHKMDVEIPVLNGLEERRALASAEEFDAQRRYKEALTQYLHARSLTPHPTLHFLVGITCVKLGMYQHAEVALRKSIQMIEADNAESPATQRLHASASLVLCNLNFQSSNKSDRGLVSSLQKASKNENLKAHQKSFVLSALAALLSADSSKPKLAEEPALEAHRLDESNAIALHVLGLVYMKRFMYARAREWLRKAILLDDHPMHHKLLVRCVWAQYEGFEGVRDKEKSTQAYLELSNAYKDSPVVSMALMMSYANSKKYFSALRESNRTLELFISSTNEHLKWDPNNDLVIELLSVRIVCLLIHGSYFQVVREMADYTDMTHPVTAATVTILGVCLMIIFVLSIIFGWEGLIIGTFGLVLLVLRGVLTMLLLSAISSSYQSMLHEPFPVPSALSVMA